MDEAGTAGLRFATLLGVVAFLAKAGLVGEREGCLVCIALAANLKADCFELVFDVAARVGVLVFNGVATPFAMGFGSSPDTCSIASSRASIAITESSIRPAYLDGDRLMMSSTKESGVSPAESYEGMILDVVLFIDLMNESSLPCSVAWLTDGV